MTYLHTRKIVVKDYAKHIADVLKNQTAKLKKTFLNVAWLIQRERDEIYDRLNIPQVLFESEAILCVWKPHLLWRT